MGEPGYARGGRVAGAWHLYVFAYVEDLHLFDLERDHEGVNDAKHARVQQLVVEPGVVLLEDGVDSEEEKDPNPKIKLTKDLEITGRRDRPSAHNRNKQKKNHERLGKRLAKILCERGGREVVVDAHHIGGHEGSDRGRHLIYSLTKMGRRRP